MNSLIKTVSVIVALSCSAAFADNDVKGNTALGDSGDFNNQQDSTYTNGDSVGGDQNTNYVTNQNTTTNTSSVQNGYGGPSNGYVTSTPVSPGQNTCVYGHGESISAAGIGISSGKVHIDEGCQKIRDESHRLNQLRQNVVMLNNLGLKDAAVSMACQDYSMRQSLRLSLPADVYNQLCKKFER